MKLTVTSATREAFKKKPNAFEERNEENTDRSVDNTPSVTE